MFVTFPNLHFGAATCPSTPKVLRTRERDPTPYSSIVLTLDLHLSLSKNLGVHHKSFQVI